MRQQFVLDCSVTMAWCFADETSKYADAVLNSFAEGYSACVPAIWSLEVCNILTVGERRKRISEAGIFYFVERLKQLPVLADPQTHELALNNTLALAREHQLSSYDAAYVELAMRKGISIATQDKKLKQTAKKIKIPLYTGTV